MTNSPVPGHPVDGETTFEPALADSTARVPSSRYSGRGRPAGMVSCPRHALLHVVLAEPLPFPSPAVVQETSTRGWMAPSSGGERSSSGTFSRSRGWESARISHWRAGASAELGEPGPRGFVSPPAALRGLRCCCYLYLWLRSSSTKSRLGICSRDTELWLPSKLGLRRALSPRPAPRPR